MEEQPQVEQLEVLLKDLFKNQMAMIENEEPLELPINEEIEMETRDVDLIVKPFAFKPPLIRVVASQLRQAWQQLEQGEALVFDWKDSILPEWLSIPRASVRVKVSQPLTTGFKIKGSNGDSLRISFKYEKLATFCYDYGIIWHDKGICTYDEPIIPNTIGSWLR